MGQKVAFNWGGGVGKVFFFQGGGALLEEASAFKKYFGPGPRPERVAINLRGFINQELTLLRVGGFRVSGHTYAEKKPLVRTVVSNKGYLGVPGKPSRL